MTRKPSPSLDEAPAISPEEYGRIVHGLVLSRIALVSCSFNSDQASALSALAEGKAIPVDIREESAFRMEGKGVVVKHRYRLSTRMGRKSVLTVDAQYELSFSAEEGMSPEFFTVFADLALPLFTWPYFRELVGSITSRADLPCLTLGVRYAPQFR